MTCPSELDLARAHTEGAAAAIDTHLASCESCRATWRATEGAIRLARELPIELPSNARREELRTALLASELSRSHATRGPRRIHRAFGFGAIAAVATVVLWLAARPPAPVAAHGRVRGLADARYELTTAAPDEIVRLHDGTIDVDVEPLGPGERFRVLVGAAEIEVHGTSFEVAAQADQLVAVRVTHGRVDVRPTGHSPALLTAGDSWTASPPQATSDGHAGTVETPPSSTGATGQPDPDHLRGHGHVDHLVADQRVPPGETGPRPETATTEPTTSPTPAAPERPAHERLPEEVAYDDAWDAMRGEHFHRSAAAFARALALAPDGPLADDARYWHAVSLAREPRIVDARSAFRELLDEHAGGTHRGEAAVMLGWLLVETHELAEAKTRFRAAASDHSQAIRDSASAGLRALHAPR